MEFNSLQEVNTVTIRTGKKTSIRRHVNDVILLLKNDKKLDDENLKKDTNQVDPVVIETKEKRSAAIQSRDKTKKLYDSALA